MVEKKQGCGGATHDESSSSCLIGARLRRREDARLLWGQGCFVGDLKLPGMLHAAFARSPHAHARVRSIDVSAARAMPGVVDVLRASDLPALARPMPASVHLPFVRTRLAAPLAGAVVRYVGEPVAVVVADHPYRAADAAAAVEVTYEPLPAVVDPEQGLQQGAPLVHDDVPHNTAARVTRAMGDIDAAFAGAAVILSERFSFARAAGGALETRGTVAQPGGSVDEAEEFELTVWDSTQITHPLRQAIAAALGLDEQRVRVVAPDVGGGFGVKGRLYPEHIAIPALALHLGRPVSWIATRQEDLLTTCQGRGQVIEAQLAARADGTILALRARITQDCGAYLPGSVIVPLNTVDHLIGPYRLPALAAEVVAVYTHTVPISPLRGGGRPQGVFVMERMLDHLARRLDRDPLDMRKANLLQPDEFPYDTGWPRRDGQGTMVYDSGDYPACLERARTLIGYDAVRAGQPSERRAGRYRGVAVTAFLESTGVLGETARVEVTPDGVVRVAVGSPSQGQGHATTLAQVCAARLGVPVEQVTVALGDSAATAHSVGTFGSRTAVVAGNAVALAARTLRARLLGAAAELLEVAVEDLMLLEGVIAVRGVPARRLTLAELAHALTEREESARLAATETYTPQHPNAYAGGAHAAVVEVDPETALVQVERYVVVHDCGTVINPTIVEGQVHGGVAHGLGNALYEAMSHDEAGQLLTATFMDYALPHAPMMPPVEVEHMESPSPFNPEGIKGAGEGGTIGALATIAGAVEDALSPFGLTLNDLPLRPDRLTSR